MILRQRNHVALVRRSKIILVAMATLLVGLSGCHYPREYARCENGDECLAFALEHPNSKYSMNAFARYMEATTQADRELTDLLWAYVVEVDSAYGYRSFEQTFPESPYVSIASLRAQTLEEDSLLNLLYQQPSMAEFESFLNDHPDSRRRKEVMSCMDDLAFWEAGEKGLDFWQEYLMAYPHGLMTKKAEKGIHDLEIDGLLADEKPGKLNESEPFLVEWLPLDLAGVSLRNQCSSDLTIYYQGEDHTYKWILAPNDTVVEFVTPSDYRIIASVDQRDVQNFEGRVVLEGGHWEDAMFYIKSPWELDLPQYPNPNSWSDPNRNMKFYQRQLDNRELMPMERQDN